jgi:hypothetical protein
MRKLVLITAVTGVAALAAACATPGARQVEMDRAATMAALGQPASEARLGVDTARARASLAWGDRWTAANLFEKANVARSTVVTRFNLATAYQRTGRAPQAAALYRSLLNDGNYTYVLLDPRYDRRDPRAGLAGSERVNVADESARRLAMMEGPAALSSGAPVSAEAAGVNASAVEGVAGPISNEQALAMDRAEAAGRAP